MGIDSNLKIHLPNTRPMRVRRQKAPRIHCQLLKEREDLKQLRLAELRKGIAIGAEQARQGKLVDGESGVR